MWSKWKKKIQDILFEETIEYEDEQEEAVTYNQNEYGKSIQTKMVYQYPEARSFKFPIIPDNTKRTNPADLPAYQRREARRSGMERKNRHQSRQDKDEKDSLNKQPFRPSEVASPIYGYQKRKREQEIKNVPAYVRKKQVEEVASIASNMDVHTIKKDEIKQTEQEIQQTPMHKQEENDSPKQSKPKRQMSTKEHHKLKRSNNKRDINHVPYNVMMTPKDNKILKQRREQKTLNAEDISDLDSLPPHYLLNDKVEQSSQDQLWVKSQQQLLEKTLKHFKVDAEVVHATQGPTVTRFEVQPALGVKVSRVRNLSDDIKLNMAAKDIRIEAPIPGKNTIGIEVPNLNAQMVGLQEIFTSQEFKQSTSPLTIGLGLTIEGHPLVTNISKMPHGLIAGATGSGKSVCINTILISLLYKSSYEDVKLLLIDPKMVELAPYNGIPHLIAPVITDVKAATASLKWAVEEMEDRYERFVKEGVRDIERYNEKIATQDRPADKMPFIVIVIDELADLMMMAPQEVEDAISRIAQKARACGIHLLVATQRPSVDVITGLIKANIPTRIAFSVSSQVDSRTIIDANGAEKLLGKGDMLLIENGSRNSLRLQGAFVSDEEVERVTNHVRSIGPTPNYMFEQEQLINQVETEEEDELLDDVIQFIFEQNSASTSLLQRQFRIGYNRAARLIDVLESQGLISAQNGSQPRQVLLSKSQYEELV